MVYSGSGHVLKNKEAATYTDAGMKGKTKGPTTIGRTQLTISSPFSAANSDPLLFSDCL